MKYFYSLIFVLGISFVGYTQTGMGTSAPNPSAVLDMVAENKGLLIPRVALTGSTDTATISNGNVKGLYVFNTQTIADVTPGFYYWLSGKWNKVVAVGEIEGHLPVTTNVLTGAGGSLVSTINGVTSVPVVPILNLADNGLTNSDGKVSLGGTLTAPTTITTTPVNTLAIEGLETSTTYKDDAALVVGSDGVVKKSTLPYASVYTYKTDVLVSSGSAYIILPVDLVSASYIIGTTDSCGMSGMATFSSYRDVFSSAAGRAFIVPYTVTYSLGSAGSVSFTVRGLPDCAADESGMDAFDFYVVKKGNELQIRNNGSSLKSYEITVFTK